MGSAVLDTFRPFGVDMPCSGGEVVGGEEVLSLSRPLWIGSCRHSQLDRAKRGESAVVSRSRVSRWPCVTSDGAGDDFERRVTTRTGARILSTDTGSILEIIEFTGGDQLDLG